MRTFSGLANSPLAAPFLSLSPAVEPLPEARALFLRASFSLAICALRSKIPLEVLLLLLFLSCEVVDEEESDMGRGFD